MNIPCHKPSRWHGARTFKIRLYYPFLFVIVFLALVAVTVVSCAPGSGPPIPQCINCMTDPADNEEGVWHWCSSHAPTPFSGPPCIHTGFLFRGYVGSPNIPITIEGMVGGPTSPNPWWKVPEQVMSIDSKNGPPYYWGKWVALDYNMWNVTQGQIPASVKYSASVRSKSPTAPLASLIQDRYNCYLAHPTAFLANCQAPLSPVARITAVADFGEDCTNLINLIRRSEGVTTELKNVYQEEQLADQDAKDNYEYELQFPGESWTLHSHHRMHGERQNETDTYDTYDEILDNAIWLHMYVYEKQYRSTGTCAEPTACVTDGHYLTMIDPQYTKVACGIYVTPDKKFKAVQNFYK